MQDFYLIRHGETDWNVKLGKLQGHTDIPLNEKGVLQARALAKLTSQYKIKRFVSSDLSRALSTAQHAFGSSSPIETDRNLREVHLGIGEGLTWDQVQEKFGADFRAQWSANGERYLDLRFPQGESRREVLSRVKNCLTFYLEKYKGESIAFVTHGYVIRTFISHLTSFESPLLIPNCAFIPFAFENSKMIYKGPQTSDLLVHPRIEL